MSATIPIRVAGGQVLQVPPMRLAWASTRPRLIALMDVLAAMQLGTWRGAETERLGICAEFLSEVVGASGYAGPELEADVSDCMIVHGALRGIAPDPTKASAEA